MAMRRAALESTPGMVIPSCNWPATCSFQPVTCNLDLAPFGARHVQLMDPAVTQAGSLLRIHLFPGPKGKPAHQQGEVPGKGKCDKESEYIATPQKCAGGKDDCT